MPSWNVIGRTLQFTRGKGICHSFIVGPDAVEVCAPGRNRKYDLQSFSVIWVKLILYLVQRQWSIESLEVEVSDQLQAVSVLHWENNIKGG
jgi:hypothetical protein